MAFLKYLCFPATLAVVLALSVSDGHSTEPLKAPDKIWHKHIGGVKYEDVQTKPKASATGKPKSGYDLKANKGR